MEIITERLRIVPQSFRYLDAVHSYSSDADATRYMMHLPNSSMDETAEFLRECEAEWRKDQPSYYEFAVQLGGETIGAVSLYPEEDNVSAELGWIINPAFQRRGFAFEAAQGLMKYAAESLGIKRFVAHCDTENTASYRMMEKLGMTRADEYGGRFNRGSDEERREYLYEYIV